MKAPQQSRRQRCAVYTRKSTEHNLDLAFNSLDAQREACEAYIKSQEHEGWVLVPAHYDDGGLSGASLERPALQQLLAAIREGQVDIIVVYKVDRLTRALADFAKLVETFDAHGVAFVSVTQSFNTTTSMGRLTLNVLLSFAQFEREVIGERVRDKIAASKRKGLWVGGPVPLGYCSVGKSLQVEPQDAETVRTIFARYLVVGSTRSLADDLYQRGIRPRYAKGRGASPRISPADRFMVGPLGYMLRNRFYIGEIVYRGEVHQGQHEPILDRATFEVVQQRLSDTTVARRAVRSQSAALLSGLLFDDRGNRMSPTHCTKQGARYRYYVSQAVQQNRRDAGGSVVRVAAPDIEARVVAALREHRRGSKTLGHDQIQHSGTPDTASDRDLLVRHVDRIVLREEQVEIVLRRDQRDGVDAAMDGGGEREPQTVITIPWSKIPQRRRKGIATEPNEAWRLDPRTQQVLLTRISHTN